MPASGVAGALSFWMGGFRTAERQAISTVLVGGRGGSTGLDVGLFHRVEAEQKRLQAAAEDADSG